MTHTTETDEAALTADGASLDIAALYLRHREAMFKVAATVLRGADGSYGALDAVNDAIVSIMSSPRRDEVRNWEAFLVNAAKRKAQDHLRSAHARRAAPAAAPLEVGDQTEVDDVAEEVIDGLERQQTIERVQECLTALDDRHRYVLWETVALERPNKEVAAELGVSPPRISQMKTRALTLLQEELVRKEGRNDG